MQTSGVPPALRKEADGRPCPFPPHVEQSTPASVLSLLPKQTSREARLADRSCVATRLDEGATTEILGRKNLVRKQLRSILTDGDESE